MPAPTRRQDDVLHGPPGSGTGGAPLCSECGAAVEQNARLCPTCGTPVEGPPQSERICAATVHGRAVEPDPELAELGRDVDRVELWVRVVCIVVGVITGGCGIVLLLGGWFWLRGAVAFLFVAAVCLGRGLYGGDGDLRALDAVGWVGGARLRR